ncbi:asparagine-linked glycosylation protein [Dispira parvispora]|uniref:GDP-Man:Man(3)GlcNAc(2)-PP-Dol alpha-1,2-mannosyltransferase n=1 Tax=Dispira parvispora TaxID=1520584 RepID=A0A9W8APJ5_9FUNG|nr:asparagine-linked glycosylation protein [Dispira parvispora]
MSSTVHPLVVTLIYVLLSVGPLIYFVTLYIRFQWQTRTQAFRRRVTNSSPSTSDPAEHPLLVGFFHPYCNAGGGGERVLWTALHALQQNPGYAQAHFLVYTGDTNVTTQDIIDRVKDQFNLALDSDRLTFVFLRKRYLVDDTTYPRFTLVGQSLGSLGLAYEALQKVVPDIFIDTMGYAFTYPLVRWLAGRIPIVAYVHYPTISTDMIKQVPQRARQSGRFGANWYARIKVGYYRLFAQTYGWVGSWADLVMVNSTWTKNHIDQLWQPKPSATIVYPPCDTDSLRGFPLAGRTRAIVSVAQFRPEKNHALQIQAFAKYCVNYPELARDVKLVLIGSARHEGDRARIVELRELAARLQVTDQVHFAINASFTELTDYLATAQVGIHAMKEEHFGIGIVEYMAAGLIPIAHRSGGPELDIVRPSCDLPLMMKSEGSTSSPQLCNLKGPEALHKVSDHSLPTSSELPCGFLATTEQEYAATLHYCLDVLSEEERLSLQTQARHTAMDRFSQVEFQKQWVALVQPQRFSSAD